MQKNKFLSILFCVTSGLNDEINLGSDEHDLVSICSILIDVKQMKTVDIFNVKLMSYSKGFNFQVAIKEKYVESMCQKPFTLENFIAEVRNYLF